MIKNASKFVCANCDYTENGHPTICPECGVTIRGDDNTVATARDVAIAVADHIGSNLLCDGARDFADARAVGSQIFIRLDNGQTFRLDVVRGVAFTPADDERAHITRAAIALDAHSFTDEPAVLARIHAALAERP